MCVDEQGVEDLVVEPYRVVGLFHECFKDLDGEDGGRPVLVNKRSTGPGVLVGACESSESKGKRKDRGWGTHTLRRAIASVQALVWSDHWGDGFG